MLINVDKIILNLLRPALRLPNFYKFIVGLCEPHKLFKDNLNSFKTLFNSEVYATGQVIYLEKVLNDAFDATLRRIYIEDGNNVRYTYAYNASESETPPYIYNKSENKANTYLFNNSEYVSPCDFKVFIPSTVDNDAVTKKVNLYKPMGTIYLIFEI